MDRRADDYAGKTGNPYCGCEYVKITKVGGDKFKLVVGFVDLAGKIEWREQQPVKNADGIYLRMVGGRLIGRFVSGSFYATHGHDFTYRITCELNPDNELLFSVLANGKAERARYSRIQ